MPIGDDEMQFVIQEWVKISAEKGGEMGMPQSLLAQEMLAWGCYLSGAESIEEARKIVRTAGYDVFGVRGLPTVSWPSRQ